MPKNPESVWIQRILEQEFTQRCAKNHSYSLRAFARFLKTEPSSLNQILRGTRQVSRKKARELALRLGVAPELDHPLSASAPETVALPYKNLTVDAFTVIGEWYHYPLLQMFGLPGFTAAKPTQIARRLGITVSEVRLALARLERLDMIERDKNGEYRLLTDRMTTVGNDFTHAAFRRMQKQMLEQALAALEEVPFEKRDQSAMTFRFPPERIEEARERLKRFRREFCAEFENDPQCSEVYNLSLSFYPMTKQEIL